MGGTVAELTSLGGMAPAMFETETVVSDLVSSDQDQMTCSGIPDSESACEARVQAFHSESTASLDPANHEPILIPNIEGLEAKSWLGVNAKFKVILKDVVIAESDEQRQRLDD